MRISLSLRSLLCLVTISASLPALQAITPNPGFFDRWALTIPNGRAGWLEVTKEDGYYDASILWGGGSVVPVDNVVFQDADTMVITRSRTVERKDSSGEVVRTQRFSNAIYATIDGDHLAFTIYEPQTNGKGIKVSEFTGKRILPLPPKPNLKKVKYGKPIALFDGKNLDHWEILEENAPNGWSVKNRTLTNDPVQKEGQPKVRYGNLRTKDTFEDFNLKLEVMVPEKGNSGIYLRGIYEIQVAATYGRGLDSHFMGGIYSRKAPDVLAEKPAGEWQTYDITLVDRHATVYLNGKLIHDNVPLQGVTGGALTSDEFKPGPIYLQGDHTQASYRNIILTPVVN